MDLNISGRTALVTAAGGGLGSAIAEALLAEGAHVTACDIDAVKLSELRDSSRWPDRITTHAFDLADHAAIKDTVDNVARANGQIDILVNISGGPPPTPVLETSVDQWEMNFHSMVASIIYLTNLVLPGMRSNKWGRIITSTSSGVITPISNLAISNGLRTSLVGWSKTLAGEVGRDGVTVNVLVPGRIATPRITALDQAKAQRQARSVEDIAQESVAAIPVGRYGRPSEYAAMAAFLASDLASYVTGSIIRVDGGLIPSL